MKNDKVYRFFFFTVACFKGENIINLKSICSTDFNAVFQIKQPWFENRSQKIFIFFFISELWVIEAKKPLNEVKGLG